MSTLITSPLQYLKDIQKEISIWDEVLRAEIYTPDPEFAAEVTFAGVCPLSTLEVTGYRHHSRVDDLAAKIEAKFSLRCVSSYSSLLGPCFSFALINAK